jgi:hypothetical protein
MGAVGLGGNFKGLGACRPGPNPFITVGGFLENLTDLTRIG